MCTNEVDSHLDPLPNPYDYYDCESSYYLMKFEKMNHIKTNMLQDNAKR